MRRVSSQLTASDDNPKGGNLPADLPGLDVDEGIRRFGGDTELYVELVTEYCTAHSTFEDEFRELVDKRDFESARRSAHSLKGVGGNISAPQLYTTAKELEQACLSKEPETIYNHLPAVVDALATVTASAEKMENAFKKGSRESDQAVAGKGVTLEPEALANILSSLGESLTDFDPVRSGEYVDMLLAGNFDQPVQADLDKLAEQVKNYDFDGAGHTLNQLIQRLEG